MNWFKLLLMILPFTIIPVAYLEANYVFIGSMSFIEYVQVNGIEMLMFYIGIYAGTKARIVGVM